MRNAIIFVFSFMLFLLIGCTEENIITAPPTDHTPPDIWWTAPDPGSTLADSVRLCLGFFDEGEVDSIRLLKNGAVMTTILPPYYSRGGQRGGEYEVDYLWDTASDSDGVYVWEARAWDASGNMGTSPALLVRVKNNPEPPPKDTSPPVVTWCSPEPGDTLDGTVELHFQVLDDVGVDSVKVYLNGREWQKLMDNGQFYDCHVNWITCEYPDGNYIVEVRAWDSSGNMGIGVGVVFTVWNNRPRVIWVPDDYETIQDAINASEDGDTVRVRAGTYREGLRLMGKEIWLESEEGPEVTTIDSRGIGEAIMCWDGEDSRTKVRGFMIIGGWNGINTAAPGIVIYNCIISAVNAGVVIGDGNGQVYNCIFDRCFKGISCAYTWGKVRNSMFINCFMGIYESAGLLCQLDYGWDLFWKNDSLDYSGDLEPQSFDIFQDPIFINDTYQLNNNSPAINSGDPSILDKDCSRSDIGVYGGPYAYTTH